MNELEETLRVIGNDLLYYKKEVEVCTEIIDKIPSLNLKNDYKFIIIKSLSYIRSYDKYKIDELKQVQQELLNKYDLTEGE